MIEHQGNRSQLGAESQGSQNGRKGAQNHQDHGQGVSGPDMWKVNRFNAAKVLAKDKLISTSNSAILLSPRKSKLLSLVRGGRLKRRPG